MMVRPPAASDLRRDTHWKHDALSKPLQTNTNKHSQILGEREREMFHLTTHSTHFIYGYMVKDHSDSEKGYLLPPHRLLLSINSKGSLYAPSHRQDNTYHSLCYTSRGALAGMRNSSMGPLHEGSIRRPIAP